MTNIRQNIRPNIRGKFGANIRGNIRPEYRPKFVLEAGCGVVWTCRDDDHDDERWRWRWRWRALQREPADGAARVWPGSKIRRVVVIDLKQRLFQLQAELDNYSNRPKADAVLFDSMAKNLLHATEMLEVLIQRLVAVPDHRCQHLRSLWTVFVSWRLAGRLASVSSVGLNSFAIV